MYGPKFSQSDRQAIRTKYLGPTDHKGPRIVAACEAGRVTMPYDHALSASENHSAACEALVRKWGWDTFKGEWVSGALPDGTYAHVWTPEVRD